MNDYQAVQNAVIALTGQTADFGCDEWLVEVNEPYLQDLLLRSVVFELEAWLNDKHPKGPPNGQS